MNYNLDMNPANKKKIIIVVTAICFVFLLSFTILTFIKSRKINNVESIALHNYSNPFVNYLDNFEDSKDGEEPEISLYQKQLAFALDYFYYEKSQSAVSTDELDTFLKQTFNIELDTGTLFDDLHINRILSKNAFYDPDESIIEISPPSPTKRERARIPITKYFESSIQKKGDTFTVTYEGYTLESAYDALNCLTDQETPEEAEEEPSGFDNSAKMMSYLDAKSNIKSAKDAITIECAQKLSEQKSSIIITYKVTDSQFFIEKIEH